MARRHRDTRGAAASTTRAPALARLAAELHRPRGGALLALVFAGLALIVYAPAFEGPFVSDDLHYVATNPYVHELSLANVLDVLDPRGTATVFVVNYTPVHLLLHALEWQVFGDDPTGFHVVNVLFHALGAALLVLVFVQAGLPAAAALFGGLFFLLHPANVEAVAWISQLKTPASFVLAMGALLAHPRRPLWGALLFGLALLAKPTAAAVLPVAAILDWARAGRVRVGWLALWAALLAGYAGAEFWTHQRSGAAEQIHPDAAVRLRSSFAIFARYVWMSASGRGVSTFHDPAPTLSWIDPAWLTGLGIALLLAGRGAFGLWRRKPEAAFWALAGASFVPVSQLFPFLYPMADRYLYMILPGLLGGALFLGAEQAPRRLGALDASVRASVRRWAPRLSAGAGALLLLVFAGHARERAAIWASPIAIVTDSARNYPEGRNAYLLRARRAAQLGDSDAAIASLRSAWERGFNRFEQLESDPALLSLHGDPRFRALVREIAGWWVEQFSRREDATQLELRTLATAYLARGERAEAIAALERALARGGPIDERIRGEIEELRAAGN